ncbi:MAG: sulfotransferase [Pirellulaceae bacterium]
MNPIFIGGCSRSGTTLLGSMLGAHPRAITTPESPFKIHPLVARYRHHGCRLTRKDIELLIDDWFLAIWRLSLDPHKLMAEIDPPTPRAVVTWLVTAYAERQGKRQFETWVDHTPANIRYVKTLQEHFPGARFIHLVRDGRAVAASVMKLDWGPNTPKEAAQWWTSYVAYGLAAEHALSDQQILRVRYEDLLAEPVETLERITAFCGIDFDEDMLTACGFRVPEYTARQHRLVGQPLCRERIDAWKSELREREIDIFEYYTGEALAYLGYPLAFDRLAGPPSTYEKLSMEFRETTLRCWNKCRFAIRKRRYVA